MKNKILPTLRITELTGDNMKIAIEKYNEKNLMPVNQNDFIRLSIELLSQLILQEKEIPIQLHL